MLIGLSGAHRTGKTTLAQAVSEATGFPFVKTGVSGMMSRLGYDPKGDLPFQDRLEVQEAILDGLLSEYTSALKKHSGLIIVDRTPLDALGYLRSEILRTSSTPEIDRRLDRYEDVVYESVNSIFAGLAFVQPGIPLVSEAGKAPANRHYQRHVSAVMLDAALDPRVRIATMILPAASHEIKSRVTYISALVDTIIHQRTESNLCEKLH